MSDSQRQPQSQGDLTGSNVKMETVHDKVDNMAQNMVHSIVDNDPLCIAYNVYVETIRNMNPTSLMTEIKSELQGYKDCIEFGPNNDKMAPEHLSGKDSFYRWSKWHTCTAAIKEKAWTPERFKEAAYKRYVSIASRYVGNLYASCGMDVH